MSNASDDEFIAALESEFGDSGYAWWWRMLEKIASQMDSSGRCSAEYPTGRWMDFLRIKRQKKLQKFLEFCAKSQKISYENLGNILKITCPKLLELRDEYSRKSGQTPDDYPDKVAPEEEVDIRKEKNIKKEIPESPPDGFLLFWEKFPRQRIGNREKAEAAYRQALKRSTAEEILAGLKSYLDSDEVVRGFAKGAAAWLNDDRWKSDYAKAKAPPKQKISNYRVL